MSYSLKNKNELSQILQPVLVDENFSFGIIVSDWNAAVTHVLLKGCTDTLLANGISAENIQTIHVPGSFELPIGARLLAQRFPNYDAFICLGCVIKGETRHDEYINTSVAIALQNMSVSSGKPFIFGVLTTENEQQATDRAGGKHGNKGIECAETALKMAALKKELHESGKKKIGF